MKAALKPQGFHKGLRLLSRPEFRKVYDEGQRRNTPLCTIFFRPNGRPQTRLGITTPKALGNAVVRNRVKRRLREVFRLNRPVISGGWDIVLNPRPAVAQVPFASLKREVLRMFPKETPRGVSSSATTGPRPPRPAASQDIPPG